MALFAVRLRFELRQVLKSPAFVVLAIYTVFLSCFALISDRYPDGAPTYPLTVSLIPDLKDIFLVIPLVLAVVYTGELVWRERDRRIHEIVDAAPHPNWAYAVPKTLAIAAVLVFLFAAGVAVAMAVQLSEGFDRIEPMTYLVHFVLPMTWDAMLVVALGVFVQVLSPHKFIGWGVMVLWSLAQFAELLPDHNLLRYGGVPPTPLGDMGGGTASWAGSWLFRVYWGLAAVLLLLSRHISCGGGGRTLGCGRACAPPCAN